MTQEIRIQTCNGLAVDPLLTVLTQTKMTSPDTDMALTPFPTFVLAKVLPTATVQVVPNNFCAVVRPDPESKWGLHRDICAKVEQANWMAYNVTQVKPDTTIQFVRLIDLGEKSHLHLSLEGRVLSVSPTEIVIQADPGCISRMKKS